MIKFTPLGDRLIINRVEGATKIGELFIPAQAVEVPQEGIVIAVGKGPKRGEPCNVCNELHESGVGSCFKKGDRILFGRFAGCEVRYRTQDDTRVVVDMQFIREEDVIGDILGYEEREVDDD